MHNRFDGFLSWKFADRDVKIKSRLSGANEMEIAFRLLNGRSRDQSTQFWHLGLIGTHFAASIIIPFLLARRQQAALFRQIPEA